MVVATPQDKAIVVGFLFGINRLGTCMDLLQNRPLPDWIMDHDNVTQCSFGSHTLYVASTKAWRFPARTSACQGLNDGSSDTGDCQLADAAV